MANQVEATIQVRVDRIGQLFDTLDPLPIAERDLSGSTEEFIVGWARELPHRQPLRIVVHAPLTDSVAPEDVVEAVRHHFRYGAARIRRELKELFRVGRLSLAIGVAVLAMCIVVGQWLIVGAGENYVARFFYEGLIIIGWVANWRPLEIFLYGWWPLMRQELLYLRLAQSEIDVKEDDGPLDGRTVLGRSA